MPSAAIKAAELSVKVKRVTFLVFCSMSLLAVSAGILYTSRLASAAPGRPWLWLDAIASSYIGGVSLAVELGSNNTIVEPCHYFPHQRHESLSVDTPSNTSRASSSAVAFDILWAAAGKLGANTYLHLKVGIHHCLAGQIEAYVDPI